MFQYCAMLRWWQFEEGKFWKDTFWQMVLCKNRHITRIYFDKKLAICIFQYLKCDLIVTKKLSSLTVVKNLYWYLQKLLNSNTQKSLIHQYQCNIFDKNLLQKFSWNNTIYLFVKYLRNLFQFRSCGKKFSKQPKLEEHRSHKHK